MKKEVKNDLVLISKGFFIGSSMSVPGVSGGTMAILLGIYDRLISSISNFFKDVKGNLLYLVKFCLGAGLGIGSLAFLIEKLLKLFPLPVSFFFLGAVIGGIPALFKKTKAKKIKFSSIVYFLIGLVIVVAIGFLPTGSFHIGSGSILMQIIMLLITGIIIAVALILPGISTSHMLLVLGMYDTMLAAITDFNILFIGVLGIAVLIGVVLTTKPLEWTMRKFPHQTYCMIIGFVLGSSSEIFRFKILPSIPDSPSIAWCFLSIIVSIITFVLGFIAIMTLSKHSVD